VAIYGRYSGEHQKESSISIGIVTRWSGREDLASGPACSLPVAKNTATFSF